MCAGLIPKQPLLLPTRIYFEANFDTLEVVDYPVNNAGRLLLSGEYSSMTMCSREGEEAIRGGSRDSLGPRGGLIGGGCDA
jgi:hypothetical protein